MNGAESLVKTLLASGVDVCFANPGTSEMHFVAALDAHPQMRCILCLFEGGATGAADAYFRMTGKVAATLLHLAPGFGNGFANLHNARKARSAVVNIMGDHASYHLAYESPLKGDTAGISRVVSHWTKTCEAASFVAVDGAAAVTAAQSMGGQIATLILPANTAWENADAAAVSAAPAALRRPTIDRVRAAAQTLQTKGASLMVDGLALRGSLALLAAKIAKKSGCALLAPFFVSRIQRGAGAVKFQRLAYVVEENSAVLKDQTSIVLCGAKRPANFFAYPGKPSLPEPAGCAIYDLCEPEMDYAWTLHALADELGAHHITLGNEELQPLALPALPSGAMSLQKVGEAIAALMPENTVVVEEAITSAGAMALATRHARPHDWMMIKGGAIGGGLPMSIGAAVACPDQKVLCLSGDGSAMYTLQALWTMAREQLDVTVVIFSNRGYQILRGELANVGVTDVGRNAVRMLDVAEPTLDWVALAKGHGVAGIRVRDAGEFVSAFQGAMKQKGPFLIEVMC